MLIEIDASDARPMYLQIMDEIHRALATGEVGPEDPLPSVRELSAQLGINPNTVKQAYRELEREGVVYARRGLGTFAADVTASAEGRKCLGRDIARRALRDAYRSGIQPAELIEAIRQESVPDSQLVTNNPKDHEHASPDGI
jgi:GntR family transcriptional regulator